MKDFLIYTGLIVLAIGWIYTGITNSIKAKRELKDQQLLRLTRQEANKLIVRYHSEMMTHLAQPIVWLNHISATEEIPDEIKVEFLKRFQDFYPYFEALVDWDGPNLVRIQRLPDWTIEIDRSKYAFFRTEEDVCIVDDKGFEELMPQKLKRIG